MAVKRGLPGGGGEVLLNCDEFINPKEWVTETEPLEDPEGLTESKMYQVEKEQLIYAAKSVVFGKRPFKEEYKSLPLHLEGMPYGFDADTYARQQQRGELTLFSLFEGCQLYWKDHLDFRCHTVCVYV